MLLTERVGGSPSAPVPQVQLDLILLPHGLREIAALLASSTVRAFGGALPPIVPGAEFCAAVRPALRQPQSQSRDTAQTSRGRRTAAGFTTPTFDDHGLCDQLLARPAE
jgi:uncharacterized membrane protein